MIKTEQEALFTFAGPRGALEEKNYRHLSFWQDVGRRYKQNKINGLFALILFVIILSSIIIPLVRPNSIVGVISSDIKAKPSLTHWWGCDKFGHDVFVKVWKGGQISFFVGFISALFQTLIGVILGCISGYYGGKVDMLLMRLVDVLISIPYLIVVLAIRVVMGGSIWTIIFALVVTGWLPMARLVRGQILQLKNEDYIMAAQSLGVSSGDIIFHHFVPNILGVVIVQFTLSIPSAMFSEAFLSFIGLGSGTVSWGSLIRAGMEVRNSAAIQLIGPSVLLALTMFCVQLNGDAIRDALDPKLRG
ncbi:MAG: ABC transporter permease [Treponema sp.]|jgi:oligopeptide transport system permease protein|nr:ABC transporter permease [Treponema sp.]